MIPKAGRKNDFTYLILLAGFIIGTIEWQWIVSRIQDKIRWGRIESANYWYEKHRETINDTGRLLYSWPCRISRGLVGLLVIAVRTSIVPIIFRKFDFCRQLNNRQPAACFTSSCCCERVNLFL